jgi:hypothetical protein
VGRKYCLGLNKLTLQLITYCGVHDACAMGPDAVRYVTDVDGVQVFIVARSLNKDLKK